MTDLIRETFADIVRKDEPNIDLGYAALLMAEHLTQPFDTGEYLDRLDRMAAAVKTAVQAAQTDQEVIQAINSYLFGQIRFLGNSDDYYDPHNSFLNWVLDLRRGIPITLSLIYLELGRRLELPLWGIGMPGHFIVAYGAESNPIYIDPFNQGRILSEADCFDICNVSATHQSTFKEQFLRPVSKRAILYRMLLNLKYIYFNQLDWEAALKTVDMMRLVRPDYHDELRDRGLILSQLGRRQEAIAALQRYLFLMPDGKDAATLKERIATLESELLRLN